MTFQIDRTSRSPITCTLFVVLTEISSHLDCDTLKPNQAVGLLLEAVKQCCSERSSSQIASMQSPHSLDRY